VPSGPLLARFRFLIGFFFPRPKALHVRVAHDRNHQTRRSVERQRRVVVLVIEHVGAIEEAFTAGTSSAPRLEAFHEKDMKPSFTPWSF